MLILDLDDTIFKTKSMNPKLFDSAIDVVKKYYRTIEATALADKLIAELWSIPIDVVFSKYSTPKEIELEFYQEIAKIDFNKLDISVFEDYRFIQTITKRKFLVTTGLKELQFAKIKALEIESDFEAIYIDDPRLTPRNSKRLIFEQILQETQQSPHEIWVIGDNPDSEIKAGKDLNMNTIQRKSSSKKASKYADYEITSFEELKYIINKIS